MAIRRPLYVGASGNLHEMTDAQIDNLRALACWKYAETNNLTFSNTFTITDTRLQAGASASSSTGFHSADGTPDISTVTTTTLAPTSAISTVVAAPTDSGYTYPVYFDGSNIKAMSQEDFYDTVIKDAVERLVSGVTSTTTNGTYGIRGFSGTYASAPTVSGYTGVQLVAIDTRAALSSYDVVPETVDQSESITSYYLYRQNRSSVPVYTAPAFVTSSGNIRSFTDADSEFNTALSLIFNATTSIVGSRVKYDWASSGGASRGTVLDTTHNGTGNYQALQSGDTYYSQEWPNGSVVTANTYTFKIHLY